MLGVAINLIQDARHTQIAPNSQTVLGIRTSRPNWQSHWSPKTLLGGILYDDGPTTTNVWECQIRIWNCQIRTTRAELPLPQENPWLLIPMNPSGAAEILAHKQICFVLQFSPRLLLPAPHSFPQNLKQKFILNQHLVFCNRKIFHIFRLHRSQYFEIVKFSLFLNISLEVEAWWKRSKCFFDTLEADCQTAPWKINQFTFSPTAYESAPFLEFVVSFFKFNLIG